MKLFSMIVLYKVDLKQDILKKAFDLTSFNRFQRSAVQEFLCFAAKTLTERTQIGEKQSVKEAEYRIHIFVRSDSLVGVCLSDQEYLHRVAHTSFRRFYKPGQYNLWFSVFSVFSIAMKPEKPKGNTFPEGLLNPRTFVPGHF